ncbi:MAG: hypothetical protein FJ148_08825 [Deltaproteobacteria bacterium]|nr:hypothetical protein [Deltaproteobacteria bacterium]
MALPVGTGALGRVQKRIACALAVGTGIAAGLAARGAHACATCFGGQPNDWTGGFLLGTMVMLALPPLIVVGAGFAIYRSMKRQEARVRERDAARAALQHGAS